MSRLFGAILLIACCSTASAQIDSFNPPFTVAGSPGFNLTISGTFRNLPSQPPTVTWSALNQGNLSVQSSNATQITVTVPPDLIAYAGTAVITVRQSNLPDVSANYVVRQPTPVISSISPATAVAGSPGFTLTVNGSNFLNPDCVTPCPSTSIVNWGGTPLATSYLSTTQLTAAVPASLLLSPATVPITAVNPDGGTSNSTAFNVTYPLAVITSISPSSANAGGPAFPLAVFGTGLFRGSVIQWNGANLPTGISSNSLSGLYLTATIPSSLIAQAGIASVTVANPGVAASNSARFNIIGQPTIISVSPGNATAGDPSLTLTVLGTFFQTGSTVLFNGQSLPTTFVSASQLNATLSGSLLSAGTSFVNVATPSQANTGSLPFSVGQQSVVLTSLSPNTVVEGGPSLFLTANGSGFSSQTVLYWGTQPLATTYVSSSQLTALIPASLVAKAATVVVSAVTPNRATSNGISFVINPTPIAITSINPGAATVGSAALTVTVTGTGFLPGVGALWNGVGLASTYVSATQFTAAVPANLLTTVGTATIRAANPNGPQSNGVAFAITAPTLTLTSITPNTAGAGGPAITLVATGAGFQNGAQVLWAGAPLATTYVSSTQLSALVSAALLTNPGVLQGLGFASVNVSVANPAPNAAVSNALVFTLTTVPLTLTSITPAAATAGGDSVHPLSRWNRLHLSFHSVLEPAASAGDVRQPNPTYRCDPSRIACRRRHGCRPDLQWQSATFKRAPVHHQP